jgi:hypothetical protein
MRESIRILESVMREFNDSIKETLRAKGIDNTREASESLRIESDKDSVKSIGVDYIEYLDRGRPPGKFPPVDKIRQWVSTKPVEINPYLVGKKISIEGTEIFKNPSKGLELDDKISKLQDELKKSLPKGLKADILNTVKNKNNGNKTF